MRILLLGRGVISGVTGWALEQGGHDVEYLVRPGRAATYGPTIELDVLDGRARPWGRPARESWPVRYRESLLPDHDFDLVVVSVPHFRLPQAVALLAPTLGSATLLVLGNVWTEPAEAVAPIPLDQVAWAFPAAGGGFGSDGVLRAALLPTFTVGTLHGSPNAREIAVREVFRSAGLRPAERRDIRGWLWLHMLADAGMHAQGLRLGSLSQLVGRPRDLREAMLTVRELLPLLEARGVDLRGLGSASTPFRAPSALVGGAMAVATRRMAIARLSLAAHDDPEAEEPRAVVRDVLASLREHGLRAPRLESAEQYLS
jgi:2-dehydropantoate 2-reductase